MGGLLQTDPQERAKTTTASSGCRPRPTAPDPVVAHGNSQMQATARQTNAGEATSTARNIEVREQVDYPIYLYVLSYLSMSEAIIHPSVHRSPPATRVRWRLEVALAGVVEQHPQFRSAQAWKKNLERCFVAVCFTESVKGQSVKAYRFALLRSNVLFRGPPLETTEPSRFCTRLQLTGGKGGKGK